MSADNWTICPKCKWQTEAASDSLKLQAAELYGKAKPEEYLAALKAAEQPINLDDSLREDCRVGICGNGKFFVEYRARCDCGFQFSFKHEEKAFNHPTKEGGTQ